MRDIELSKTEQFRFIRHTTPKLQIPHFIAIDTQGGRIINASTGEEVFRKSGMKKIFKPSTPPIASVWTIILEEEPVYGILGLVQFPTLGFDKDILSNEFVDAKVYVKRRRQDVLHRRVRPRLDNKYIIPPSPRTEDLNTIRAPMPATAVVRRLHLQQRLHLHSQSKRKKKGILDRNSTKLSTLLQSARKLCSHWSNYLLNTFLRSLLMSSNIFMM